MMEPNSLSNQVQPERSKYVKLMVIATTVVVLDQITKAVILNTMALYQVVPVIPGFFNITFIYNPGGAFGFLAQHQTGWVQVMFVTLIVAAAGLVFYFYKNTPAGYRWLASAYALIFGGAIGNLIDRLRFGKVVDFLDFNLVFMRWPAFNVADSAVTIGIVIFAYHLLLDRMPDA